MKSVQVLASFTLLTGTTVPIFSFGQVPALPPLAEYKYTNYDPSDSKIFAKLFQSGTLSLTDAFPEDARPWSPWFLSLLRDGKRVLNYGEIARVREAVALQAYHSTKLLKASKMSPTKFVADLDSALQDAFNQAKIEEPSNELIQVCMAEMVCHWVTTKFDYRAGKHYHSRRFGDLLNFDPDSKDPKYTFVCDHSSTLSFNAVNQWEKYRKSLGKGTGIISLALRGYLVGADGNSGSHGWFGVSISCSKNRRMKIQMDSTPGARSTPSRRLNHSGYGALSRAGCELVAASHLLIHLGYDNETMYTGPVDILRQYKKAENQHGVMVDDPFVKEEEKFYFGAAVDYVPRGQYDRQYGSKVLQSMIKAKTDYLDRIRPLKDHHQAIWNYYNRHPF